MKARDGSPDEMPLDMAIVALWLHGMTARTIARHLQVARIRVRRATERWHARQASQAVRQDEGGEP